MYKLSADDIAVLAAVDANFPKLRMLLKAKFDDYVIKMVQAPEGHQQRQAGRAAELLELIQALETAKDVLTRTRAR